MAEDTDIHQRIKITRTDGTATTFKRKPTFKTHRNKITKLTENKTKGNDGTERYILRQLYMDSLLEGNRFAVLSEPEDEMETDALEHTDQTDAKTTQIQTNTPTVKTKPIFIYTNDHNKLIAIAKNIKTCTLKHNVDHTTAKTTTYDDEKLLIHALKSNRMEYFTFHKKESQPIKYFIKHIPTDITIADITEDLQRQNINATNVQRFFWFEKNQKTPTTKIILTINKTDAQQINRLHDICHIKVDIELYKQTKPTLKQCHRCLFYGHHSDNCGRNFRCMRCGQDGHNHNTCTVKTKTDTPTCANCRGEHPANYKGCSYYKETLTKRRNAKEKRDSTANKTTNTRPTFTLTKQEFPTLPTKTTEPTPTTSNTNTNTNDARKQKNPWGNNRPNEQTDKTNETTDSLKEILTFLRELNLPRILTTLHETMKKFREADSTMAKVMVLFEALSNFF